jgi:hypothetical protein
MDRTRGLWWRCCDHGSRACQRAADRDATRLPDGTIKNTKEEFFEELEGYLTDAASIEGRVRLVLPAHILELHAESLDAFNAFTRVMDMKIYDEAYHRGKEVAFENLHSVKERLETSLRDFLRTEHLLRLSKDES